MSRCRFGRPALATVALALTSGCPWICPQPRSLWVYVSSDEPLDLGLASWSEGDPVPGLRLGASDDAGGARSRETPLTWVAGEGFALPDGAFLSVPCDSERDCAAERYTLSFELAWEPTGDTGAADLPTMTAPGDATEMELWEGWAVHIETNVMTQTITCP